MHLSKAVDFCRKVPRNPNHVPGKGLLYQGIEGLYTGIYRVYRVEWGYYWGYYRGCIRQLYTGDKSPVALTMK